ncbi:hypothetical protein DPV78_008018 [Talaromyces pinophilus]|nr:hypothetical protein DPV78_008018 [Talaromyces pinophilus]
MNTSGPPDNPDAPLYVGSSKNWAFNRGAVDGDGEVTSPCENRFLIELIARLDRGYEDIFRCLVSYSSRRAPELALDNEHGAIHSQTPKRSTGGCDVISDKLSRVVTNVAIFFVEIAREVRRLQRYQSLYPDESMMQTFQTAILSKISLNHDKWTRIIGKSHTQACWTRLQKSEYLIELWMNHPTYQYDLKPWKQFLDNDAPGSGVNPKTKFIEDVIDKGIHQLSQATFQGNFHILPPGGWALWRMWVDRFHDFEHRIHRTVVPAHMRTKSRNKTNSKFDTEMNELEPMLCNYQTMPFLIYPNLWYPKGDRETAVVDDILPDIETFIGDLEGYDMPDFDDPLSRGMLVASHPSTASALWHRGNISIM